MSEHIHGRVAPGFERVREVFAANFDERDERGASLCVDRRGERVVDLWGGDADRGRPFTADTPCVLFSCTKGLVASCLLVLVERGDLDLDAVVQRYWPSLRTRLTVRQLLNHRSGLVALDHLPMEALGEPEALAQLLEVQRPLWRPGQAQGYGAVTAGLYNAELLRRITTTTVGPFFKSEVAPDLDLYIGLPREVEPARLLPIGRSDIVRGVVPTALAGTGMDSKLFRAAMSRGSATQRATSQPKELGARGLENFNRREILELELPWAGGVGTARGLATLYGRLARAEGPWSAAVLRPLHARQSWARRDRVLRKSLGWSQGFLKEEPHLFSPNTESFGHPGAGGSFGFADPVEGLGLGFVTRKMGWRLRPHRARVLCRAIYDSLAQGA